MRKLVLEMEALQVETFETAESRGGNTGTVRAHGDSYLEWCVYYPGDITFDCSRADCTGNCGLVTSESCQGPGCYTREIQDTV